RLGQRGAGLVRRRDHDVVGARHEAIPARRVEVVVLVDVLDRRTFCRLLHVFPQPPAAGRTIPDGWKNFHAVPAPSRNQLGYRRRRTSSKGNPMTLSDLAAIGSLVSGFAVLISLVYLSLQVKQTERNQQ